MALPALLRAAKIQERAAQIGFDWPAARLVIAKIAEEIAELEAELDGGANPEKVEDEMGDILFAAANLARKLDLDPEAALRRATAKFERRFRRVEALAAERGIGGDLDALEAAVATGQARGVLMQSLLVAQAGQVSFGQADRQVGGLAVVAAAQDLAVPVDPSECFAVG